MAKSKIVGDADVDEARAKAFEAFIKAQNRKDPGAIYTYAGAPLQVASVSTGAMTLDLAIGSGGMPRGRITEIFGPESVGKTSLALSTAAQAIRAGGTAALVDVEHAIGAAHLEAMGVDPTRLAIAQPDTGEQAFTMMSEMLESGVFDVIILDSVAALVPKAELEGELDEHLVAAQARMIGKGIRWVTSKIRKSNAAVIFINQLRDKVGGYGNPEQTPGGKALKYAASVRIDLRSPAGARIMNGKEQVGMTIRGRTVKNKLAPPMKDAEFNLIFGQGIDYIDSVVEAAKTLGVITGDGAHRYVVTATGQEICNAAGEHVRGFPKVKDAVAENEALAKELTALCYAALTARTEAPESVDEPIGDAVFA